MNADVGEFVIRLHGVASTGEAIPQPCYLREGDVVYVGPNPEITGIVYRTESLEEAKRFATWDDAVNFWKSTSTLEPTRPDGKPNRPFTAYHVSFVPIRAAAGETA